MTFGRWNNTWLRQTSQLFYIACCSLGLLLWHWVIDKDERVPGKKSQEKPPSAMLPTFLIFTRQLKIDLVFGLFFCLAPLNRSSDHSKMLLNQRGLKMSLLDKTFFNVWARYFAWNFKGYLWIATQNALPTHLKVWFSYKVRDTRAFRWKSLEAFLKWSPATSGLLDWTCTQALSNMHQTCCLRMSCHRPLQMGIVYVNTDLQAPYIPRIMQGLHFLVWCCDEMVFRLTQIFRVTLGRICQESSLKWKCCHFDEIFITGCTGSCHFDNFQCSQWRKKYHENDDIRISVMHRSLFVVFLCFRNWLFYPYPSRLFHWHWGIIWLP